MTDLKRIGYPCASALVCGALVKHEGQFVTVCEARRYNSRETLVTFENGRRIRFPSDHIFTEYESPALVVSEPG